MFIKIKWIDLWNSLEEYILKKMLISFNVFFNVSWNSNIPLRFLKKNTDIYLFYLKTKDSLYELKGICIGWKINGEAIFYLDKFFTFENGLGIGSKMFSNWIQLFSNKNMLLWRTTSNTLPFYLKMKEKNNISYNFSNLKYHYLSIGQKQIKKNWTYEDIYDLKISPCF